MSDHDNTQPERSPEDTNPAELDDSALTTVAGGAQVPAPPATSLKAGASEVLMESVVSGFKTKK